MKKLFLIISILIINLNFLYSEENQPDINSQSPMSIFKNAIRLFNNGDVDNAIKKMEELSNYNFETTDYYEYLGYMYFVYGEYSKASEIMNKVLVISPNSIIAHIVLGEIFYQKNDILNCRNIYLKLVKLEPELKIAYIRLYELLKNNNPKEANKYYIKIFQLPATKLEKYLTPIEDVKLTISKNPIFMKDIDIEKNINVKEPEILNEIFSDTEKKAVSNKSSIITTVRKNRKLNINFNFIKAPIINFNIEKFYIKLIEIIFVLLYFLFRKILSSKKEKMLQRFVITHYKVIPTKNSEKGV